MIKHLLASFFLLMSMSTFANQEHTSGPQFCHGVGHAVGMIQYGRATGVEDSENEAVHFIDALSVQTKTDLLASVDQFIRSSSPLPSAWTRMLFTHACMYNYAEDLEQIKRISRRVPYQCDVKKPDVACLKGVVNRMAENQII